MRHCCWSTCLLAILLGKLAFAQTAATIPSGADLELAASCAACHRPGGGGSAIPALVGLDEAQLATILLEYRSGVRRSQIMRVIADAISPEEIVRVAHALASRAGQAP